MQDINGSSASFLQQLVCRMRATAAEARLAAEASSIDFIEENGAGHFCIVTEAGMHVADKGKWQRFSPSSSAEMMLPS